MGPEYRLLTIALLALVTIIAFEAMAISTAMPIVAADLHAVRSYGLAFSFMLTAELLGIVLAGVWADRAGPLPSLVAGQLLVAAGSSIAGLALTFPMLLVGRLVAGLGAGLIVVALYVVIGRAFPDSLRPKVFGWISAAWVLPSLIGPPISGWLATTWSWRWVFLIVVAPIAVTFTIVLSRRERIQGTPRVPAEGGDQVTSADRVTHRRLAWLGLAVALAAGLMQWGAEHLVPLAPVALVATVIGLVGVILVAPRLVPPGTVRMSRGLPSVMLSRFLLTASFNGSMTFVPLMLVAERHLSPTMAGLMLTVGALGWSFGAAVQGKDVFQPHKSALVSAGGAFLTVGIGLLAAVAGLGWHHDIVGLAAILSGVGMGLAMSSISVLALDLSDPRDHGRVSSALNLSDVLGSVMGLSVAGAVFAALHRTDGSDVPVFVLMWLVLTAVAALVVVGGQRTRT